MGITFILYRNIKKYSPIFSFFIKRDCIRCTYFRKVAFTLKFNSKIILFDNILHIMTKLYVLTKKEELICSSFLVYL